MKINFIDPYLHQSPYIYIYIKHNFLSSQLRSTRPNLIVLLLHKAEQDFRLGYYFDKFTSSFGSFILEIFDFVIRICCFTGGQH